MKLAWFNTDFEAEKLKCHHLDVMYERVDEVEDSRKTMILTGLTAMVCANAEWTKI